METRICRKCGKEKPLSELRKTITSAGNICYNRLCIECDNKRRKALVKNKKRADRSNIRLQRKT